ncbi:MAG: DNA primase [Candidatus Lokiarchaeota archaeon]|nr:DNA primase [Candidatus Lokiarchaeota archaeon]MBD3199930.1 DNA primase [Candidatus Lokiarchaeota archaeon]
MRDLQKSGRIGRIEVGNESTEGISEGYIKIPSSLTRKETALLAATVETVTRVGPCEADMKLLEIRDVRERKRKKIIERAAELLKQWDQKSLDASEIEEQIDTDIKLAEIISWGRENLPAGPDVEKDDELIIVEGRADVLNLLRIGIKNTVAVQGTSIPKSVIELIEKKQTVTAFLDGDRGGTLILKELMQMADIDFLMRAPEGFEVEELTRKQMIKALQGKKPANAEDIPEKIIEIEEEKEPIEEEKENEEVYHGKEKVLVRFLKKLEVKDKNVIIDAIRKIDTGKSIGFNKDEEELFDLPVSELFEKIKEYEKIPFLIIDGILTNRLLSALLNMDIKFIACKNKEEELNTPNNLAVYYF